MARITVSRALEDYVNRSFTRNDARGMDEQQIQQEIERRTLIGVVGRSKYQLFLEIPDERMARRLIEQCDEAIADPKLHEAKRGAIQLTRKQIVTAFPNLG